MTPERFAQIDRVLKAALERPESQRAAFLDEACAGDEALRKEVESLLAFDERARSFMEAPTLEAAAQALAENEAAASGPGEADRGLSGQVISHYRVLEKLGGGGMVWSTRPKTRSYLASWRLSSCPRGWGRITRRWNASGARPSPLPLSTTPTSARSTTLTSTRASPSLPWNRWRARRSGSASKASC